LNKLANQTEEGTIGLVNRKLAEYDKMKLALLMNSHTELKKTQIELLKIYHQKPANDVYTIKFEVRAEGFATSRGSKKIEIHWSNHTNVS